MEGLARLELLTLLLPLETLLEDGKADKALKVIKEVLEEAGQSSGTDRTLTCVHQKQSMRR